MTLKYERALSIGAAIDVSTVTISRKMYPNAKTVAKLRLPSALKNFQRVGFLYSNELVSVIILK
jgi:hypothetical protein